MKITAKDGRSFEGTALQIVQQMKSMAFNGTGTLAEYVQWVIDNTLRFSGIALEVKGETDDELAQSLVAEFIRHGLAVKS